MITKSTVRGVLDHKLIMEVLEKVLNKVIEELDIKDTEELETAISIAEQLIISTVTVDSSFFMLRKKLEMIKKGKETKHEHISSISEDS